MNGGGGHVKLEVSEVGQMNGKENSKSQLSDLTNLSTNGSLNGQGIMLAPKVVSEANSPSEMVVKAEVEEAKPEYSNLMKNEVFHSSFAFESLYFTCF